jgi:hypothetical protein
LLLSRLASASCFFMKASYSGVHIGQERLQGRSFQRSAREGTIVVMVGDEPPAVDRLTLDIGLTGLALGVERIECKIEVMLGRLAGVDGATGKLADEPVHVAGPKKIGMMGIMRMALHARLRGMVMGVADAGRRRSLVVLLNASPQRVYEIDHPTWRRGVWLLLGDDAGLFGLEVGDERLLVTVAEGCGTEIAGLAVENVLIVSAAERHDVPCHRRRPAYEKPSTGTDRTS